MTSIGRELRNANDAILPVLDLLGGQVVRGVAGRRDEYRPIASTLVPSAEPLDIARALRSRFGFTEFYVADLDAIVHGQPDWTTLQQLTEAGFSLWIDAGLSESHDGRLQDLMGLSPGGIIIGLESVAGPDALAAIVAQVGAERAVFSLDLKAGAPLGRLDAWQNGSAWEIARTAIERNGLRRMIVLDLARVGVGSGVGTEELCAKIKQTWPHVQLTAGGGVRSLEDVQRLQGFGVDRVLVASALHDGRIPPR
jgi:phosphoribosylformimino-5-aminoimidazole carboxamide ribotide isomerase